jgi:hypothetical protein
MRKSALLSLVLLMSPLGTASLFGSSPFQFGMLRSAHATLHVTEGSKACHEVRLPECWHEVGKVCRYDPQSWSDLRIAPEEERYVFRQSKERAILIGYQYNGAPHLAQEYYLKHPEKKFQPVLSRDFYALTVAKTFNVRRATREEWDAAQPIQVRAEAPFRFGNRTEFWDNEGLHYAGKIFPKRGPMVLWDVMDVSSISQSGKYLTVHSWDGIEEQCEPFIGPCESYGGGHYWVDVFEVSTAKRLITMTGRFWKMGITGVFDNTEWLDDKYFVMPLQADLRRFAFVSLKFLIDSSQRNPGR